MSLPFTRRFAFAQQPPAPAKPKRETARAKQEEPAPAAMVDEKYGSATAIMAMPPAKLVAILKDPSGSVYAKAKACQRLAVVGDKTAVPALAALLTDEKLSHYARFALEPIPDASAGEALHAALGKVQGNLLVGVINSIGFRKDAKAVDSLSKLLHDGNPDVSKAAGAALAEVRPPL